MNQGKSEDIWEAQRAGIKLQGWQRKCGGYSHNVEAPQDDLAWIARCVTTANKSCEHNQFHPE